jgi:hypothetical protein
MPSSQDLMERLSGADPAPAPERLGVEEERVADALLAELLATPAGPGRVRRRWPRLAAASAVAALAAFAAVSLLGSDDGRTPNVVDRAVAALTRDDAVYHAELTVHFRASSRPWSKANTYFETWHTIGGRMRQRAYTTVGGRKGRLHGEFAGQRRPGRLGGPALSYDVRSNTIQQLGFGRARNYKGAPTIDPFDPGRSLRELRAAGQLRLVGRVELRGKPAYRLVSGRMRASGGVLQRSQVLIDTETFLPREQRVFTRAPDGSTLRTVWRYLVYERLPLNDRTRALLDFNPPAGAKCAPGTGRLIHKGSLGFPNPCARKP